MFYEISLQCIESLTWTEFNAKTRDILTLEYATWKQDCFGVFEGTLFKAKLGGLSVLARLGCATSPLKTKKKKKSFDIYLLIQLAPGRKGLTVVYI